ncbi:MAG TPA: amidohydrolase family protein [Patescibacteria group bacterium]|nr:amidohydrolase family protein [Patescibacteria group bacterium]
MKIQLPGLIDPHVHLRDPGQTDKEDFYTGTCAALAGGFTAIVDMPNNKVPITTEERLKAKQTIAERQIVSDLGFYFGTLGDNLDEFDHVKDDVLGLKIYLNQTTGNFLLDKKHLGEIFTRWPQDLPILFHAEGKTFDDVLEVLKEHPRKIHLCHMSSAYELKRVIESKDAGLPVTCGVTPHHLFLSEKHFKEYGSFAMMRPPLMPQADVDFLWEHLSSIDLIESDHAPHTLEEKQSDNPPNGIPGLETTLALLLTAVSQNALTLEDVKRLCHTGPKTIFGIDQGEDTYIEIDPDTEWIIDQTKMLSKSKWTPFNGWKMKGRLLKTVLRGKDAFANGQILLERGSGEILNPHLK